MKDRRQLLLIVLTIFSLQWQALANPNVRASFFSFYPSAVGTKLDTLPSVSSHCGVCHYDFKNGGSPWNPYGLSIKNVGGLNSVAGRSNAIASVRYLDQDGDTFTSEFEITNRTYLNVPTFPGLSATNISQVMNVTLSDIQTNITPTLAVDSTPPTVTLTKPASGYIYTADRFTNITWTASDAGGVAAINLYLSLDNGVTFTPVALGLANSGSYSWVPANRPTSTARIRVVAVDNAANSGTNIGAAFSIVSPSGGRVPTTLRDFDMPGTQPFEGGSALADPTTCATCHGNYSAATEPYSNWRGSMMAHASRDPIFLANLAIANQDAPDSGDLCLRCHMSRGWLQGRSVPTDGSLMQTADKIGVSCDLCHRMVDPVYKAGVSPAADTNVLAALTFAGTNYGNGMYVVDPSSVQRGPFTNAAAPHAFVESPFHRSSAFCGTCHDVSNPEFTKDGQGVYQPNTLNAASTSFSPHSIGPVERTFSEWSASAYNSSNGVYAPQFAGAKANGMVATCQDCHLRDTVGQGCNITNNPTVTTRTNLPLHDMTGGSTWIAGLLTNLYPADVDAPSIQAGISRATYVLQNAASVAVSETNGQLKVTVTNQCGHKLPTGYPEGRRIWVNVKFFSETNALVGESGAYNPTNGVLTHDAEAKVYEVHPGIDTNITSIIGLSAGESFHFVLNNKIYEDNRIPPRGFTNAVFALFGGTPAGYSYADGQYWDDSIYTVPAGATHAEVRLYYQSTSKEFVEFLRDENVTNTKGQELYNIWSTNGMCPPTLMAQVNWQTPFCWKATKPTAQGKFHIDFYSRPGLTYTLEYRNSLATGTWQTLPVGGSLTATNTTSSFEDDMAVSQRFYRIRYVAP